jgi:hypothetical protein
MTTTVAKLKELVGADAVNALVAEHGLAHDDPALVLSLLPAIMYSSTRSEIAALRERLVAGFDADVLGAAAAASIHEMLETRVSTEAYLMQMARDEAVAAAGRFVAGANDFAEARATLDEGVDAFHMARADAREAQERFAEHAYAVLAGDVARNRNRALWSAATFAVGCGFGGMIVLLVVLFASHAVVCHG